MTADDATAVRAVAGEDAQTIRQLDRSLVKGIAWTGGVKWLIQIFSWASTLVVVRLVTPEDYGVVGSAALYIGLLALLGDFGIGTAVLKMRELTRLELRQLNGAAVLFGGIAMLLGVAVSVPVGWFFRSDDVPLVLMAMSSTLFIAGFRSVPSALMQREFRFRALAIIEAAQGLVGAIATVSFALAGWGYWALAGGTITQAAAYTLLIWYSHPYPVARPRLGTIREPMRLSRHVITAQLSWWTYSNADFAIAGRALGQATLGAYLLAWQFASLPVEKITNIVTRVTPAVFSALQNDPAALRRKLLLLTEGIATLTMPASLGLSLVAGDFVRLAFGDQWLAAILPLQLLSLYISLRSVQTMLPQILVAVGDAKLVARMSVAFVIVMPLSFLIGSRWGTVGIASAWLVVFPFLNIPFYRRVFARVDLTFGKYLHALRHPIIGSIAMSVAVIVATVMLPQSTPLAVSLASKIAVGAITYAAIAIWPQRARLKALYRTARD